jgi:hypothetical protein
MAKWFASQSVEEINAKKAKLVPKNTTKAKLQTWKAFFYILVMVMDSNISTLKSSGSLLSEKDSQTQSISYLQCLFNRNGPVEYNCYSDFTGDTGSYSLSGFYIP